MSDSAAPPGETGPRDRNPTNMPCARCGAPMRPDGDSPLAASVELSCACCGARETLPGDRAARVLALRALGARRKWAEDACQGPAVAYLRFVETGGLQLASYGFGIATVIVTMIASGAVQPLPIGVVGGAAIATAIAFRIARARLQRTLVPLVRAYPGLPGRPQRCRRCGGELPAGVAALTTCSYCGAVNLASKGVAGEHAAALDARILDARAYAAGTVEAVAAAGRFVGRAFTAAFALGAGLGAALALLVQ